MNLPAILGLLLAISLGANAVLTKVWLGADRRATAVTEQLGQARSAATACSDATEALRELADKRAEAGKAATAAAEARARTAEQRANAERTRPVAPPEAAPAQACETAQAQNAEWLASRRKP